jgi:hypothetical protein
MERALITGTLFRALVSVFFKKSRKWGSQKAYKYAVFEGSKMAVFVRTRFKGTFAVSEGGNPYFLLPPLYGLLRAPCGQNFSG